MPIPAKTIKEVIVELDAIVQKSINENSKLGLFAALYKKVTENVHDGIINNRFEDGGRMELLDVAFANRYLEAYKGYLEGKLVTNAWQIAFDASKKNNVLILQHLLAGMNAHISLDLGIATAQTGLGKPIQVLEHDFLEINLLLGDLIEQVEQALSKTSAFMTTFDWFAGKFDENLARFNLELFRKRAWQIAVALHGRESHLQQQYIDELDQQVTKENNFFIHMGSMILSPVIIIAAKLENRKTAEVIKTLNAL